MRSRKWLTVTTCNQPSIKNDQPDLVSPFSYTKCLNVYYKSTAILWKHPRVAVLYKDRGQKLAQFSYALTLPNNNRFSKLFHCQNQEKICNNTITKIPPHLKFVATLPCEMSSVLKDSFPHSVTIACFSWLIQDCHESSTLLDHLLKGTSNSVIDWIQVRAVRGPHIRLDERHVPAFHWSRHWSVASPAWVGHPAAWRTHWTY